MPVAEADLVTVAYEFEIVEIELLAGSLPFSVALGDTITGVFSYDTDESPSQILDSGTGLVADYTGIDVSPTNISEGGNIFDNMDSPENDFIVYDGSSSDTDFMDEFLFDVCSDLIFAGYTTDVVIHLFSTSDDFLTSLALPSSLDFSLVDYSTALVAISGSESSVNLRGAVTALSVQSSRTRHSRTIRSWSCWDGLGKT